MIPVLRQLANQPADMAETTVGTNLTDDGVTALPYQQLLAQLAQQSADNLPQQTAEASADTTAPPELAADSSQLMPLPEIVLPEDSIVPQPLAEPASMLASWPLFGHQYTSTAMPAENAAPATIQVDTAVPGSIVASATTASLVMSPVAVADVAAQSGAVPLPAPTITATARNETAQTNAPVVLPVSASPGQPGIELPVSELPLPPQGISGGATLQQFIRQALLPRQTTDTTAVTAAMGSAGTSSHSSEALFSWKAELTGQSSGAHSNQWSQKLVHLLSDKINLQLGQQIQRAQIRLDPPQLGVIELSVSVDGERTSVQLYAANTQLREAMQQNLDQLRQQLAQRLGAEQTVNIDVRQQSQQQSGQHKTAQQQMVAAHFNDVPDDAAESAAASGANATNWLNRLV